MTAPAGALSDRLRRARERRAEQAEQQQPPTTLIDPDAPVELSSAQRRLWFLHQLDPGSAAYHIPIVHDLVGPLDADRLRRSWSAVVGRHQVLRTRYREIDGEPQPLVDDLPAGQWTESTQAWGPATAAALATPFDLAVEQPWRALLLADRDDPQRHRLVLVVHHIAGDGWSVGVLGRALAAAYRSDDALPTGAQYADFARYRRSTAGREGADLGYWRRHLDGAPALLELPTDRPRPLVADEHGHTVWVPLRPETGRAVRRLGAATGLTPFMAMLTAWHVVLGRWAGTDDVVVGTPVAGRARPEWEDLVGCCVTTIALRTRSQPQLTVRDLCEHVRDVTIDGLAHQAVGFEEVVDALGVARDVSTTPLYQVSLTVHSEPGIELDLGEVTATWVDALPPVAKADLGVHVEGPLVAHGADLADVDATVSVSYRTAMFEEATVRRLLGHVEQVLLDLADDLDRPLADLPMLTADERDALPLGLTVPAPPVAATTIASMVTAVARAHPDRVAVTSRGRDLRYDALVAEAARLATELTAVGVRRGDRVALLADRSVEVVAAMLAVVSLGAAYVPIDPLYPDARIAGLLAGARASAALVQPHLLGRLPEQTPPVVDLPTPPTAVEHDADLTDHARPDDVAYVLFTSGTTGTPKGVEVEHRHLLGYLAGLAGKVAIEPGWSWAMMTTPSADLGLTNLFGALSTGGRVHLLTYEQVTDPEQVAGYFRRHRIDAMKLVPSHLQAMWDDADPTAVLPGRLLVLAGEACPWDLVERVAQAAPGLAVHNHYGPTETTVSTMGRQVAGHGAGHRRGGATVAPIGTPFPGTRAHVLDELGRAVPDGVPGELVLAGPTVSRGYLGMPDATAERFVDEPGAATGARGYRTGDRVRRVDGEIEFLGRVDDQVKIRGYRVEPGDVTAALTALTEVSAAAVIAREDRPGVRTLCAYVVPAPGIDDDAVPEIVRARAKQTLPEHMVPADVVPLTAIPLSANGKLDRSALPDPDPARRGGTADRPPSGETEERVAAVWREVLGLDDIGATTEFFDLGGDSFSAVRVARALGSVSVVDVFSRPTVAGLAALLDGPAAEADAGLLRRLDDGSATPAVHVVCVPYGGGSAVTFAPLAAAVDGDVAVYGVDLPGHEIARREEDLQPLPEVADALVEQIRGLDGDVVLYGHCLGGALAVETALRLEQAGVAVTGVVTGGTFPAARLPGRLSRLWDRLVPTDRWLSNRSYHEMLRALGGFTDVVDERDRDFLVRALRHDARSAERYYTDRYAAVERGERPTRLAAPMLCVVGDRDRATELYAERFTEWQDFSDDVDLAVIDEAGHYFLKHQAGELARVLTGRIAAWRAGRRPRAASVVDTAPAASTRTFLIVAITQLLSMIGTGLTAFGVGIWVYRQTGSVTAFSLISVLALLPAIALMPIAGAVADRYDRRRVMLVADAIAGAATLVLLTLYLTDQLQLGFVYAFTAVGAAANAFQRPAYLAAITQLVPKRYLGQAGGLVGLGTNAGDLIAALIGGMLVGAFGLGSVIAIDVLTFSVAFTVLLLVRFPNRLWMRREESFRAEIAGGWRYIARRRPLVVMVVFFVVFNLLFAFPNVLATPLVLAEHPEHVLGLVLAGGGLGALLGAAAMALWGGTHRRAVGMVGGTVTLGVGVLVLGVTSTPVVMGAGMLLVYGSLLVLNAHWMALIQTKVGLDLQGRVLAINQMLAMSSMPIGFVLAGPLTEVFAGALEGSGPLASLLRALPLGSSAPIAGAVLVAGVAIVIWGVLGLSTRSLRRMEDDLPDAVPDAVIVKDRDQLQDQADAAFERHLREQVVVGGPDR